MTRKILLITEETKIFCSFLSISLGLKALLPALGLDVAEVEL